MRVPFLLTAKRRVDADEGMLVQVRSALLRTLARLHLVDPPCAAPAAAATDGCGVEPEEAVLLPFPIRGEALLVKLADLLRGRLMGGSESDPFVMTISRSPGSRLSIDRAAYVEFDDGRAAFRLRIEATPDSTVTLETTDFDMLVRFVIQYIAERQSDPQKFEVAS
jgi:hypothetical protein